MRDHDDRDATADQLQTTRRSVLRAGLYALGASQLPDVLLSRASAQTGKPDAAGAL